MNLNLRDLKYFEVITQEGSLALASERLSRSQPALSKCLQRLEETIGATLFIRDGRGVHLTAVGEALLEKTKQLSKAVEQTERDMYNFVQGAVGNIRIGCLPSVVEHIIPAACQKLLLESPDVKIQLFAEMSDILLGHLMSQQVDIVISMISKVNDNVIVTPIVDDPMVIIAQENHPLIELSKQREITIEDLLNYRWTMPNANSLTRMWFDQQFINEGLPKPNVQIETQSFRVIPKIVQHSDLLGFLPRRSLQCSEVKIKDLREIPMPQMTYNRQLGIYRLKNRVASPAVEKLISILCTNGEKLLS